MQKVTDYLPLATARNTVVIIVKLHLWISSAFAFIVTLLSPLVELGFNERAL